MCKVAYLFDPMAPQPLDILKPQNALLLEAERGTNMRPID